MISLFYTFALKTSLQFQCDYEKDQNWYVLGVYSACYNETNRTEVNHLAEALDKTVKYLWEVTAKEDIYSNDKPINFSYISIDVCNDFKRLPKIFESIYLDDRFHYNTWSAKSKNKIYLSKILAIYAEGPPEMMNYLTTSFDGDVRFTGKYVSYNSSIDKQQFETYAIILKYIIIHRLKWQRLLILHVQPSTVTPLYEFLKQKVVESKLCVQFKEINSSWNITQEDHFSPNWFQENKPAVITMGDKYGQVKVIKQLGKMMGSLNITIPILAEGFNEIMRKSSIAPENFDCFKDISSSFVSTNLRSLMSMEILLEDEDVEAIRKVSKLISRTISVSQRFALLRSLDFHKYYVIYRSYQCSCSLDFDCAQERIKKEEKRALANQRNIFEPTKRFQYMVLKMLDKKYPFNHATYEEYHSFDFFGFGSKCRKTILRLQDYEDVLLGNKSRYHDESLCDGKDCDGENDHNCWSGSKVHIILRY